ncbi:MAG TPA: VCBS repeat-containing protein, partial [Gemmataceae bacterium]|nr:VCBS repeat-containing protein [Gemmataceae bacterium]
MGTGPGLATVVVLRGTDGVKVTEFQPFPGYFGGVFVAAGDLNGDGKAEVVVTPDAIDAFSGPFGDQLLVRVYNGAALVGVTSIAPVLAAFDGLASLDGTSGQNNPLVKLGGRAAVADVNGDGLPDLLIAAGNGGGPRITIWNGTGFAGANGGKPTTNPLANLFVFEESQRGGAFVTAGDITGDGVAEIVVGGGPGGGPRVRIVDGAKLFSLPNLGVNLDDPANLTSGLVTNNFFSGDPNSRGGVRLTVRDVDADGKADLITGSGDN